MRATKSAAYAAWGAAAPSVSASRAAEEPATRSPVAGIAEGDAAVAESVAVAEAPGEGAGSVLLPGVGSADGLGDVIGSAGPVGDEVGARERPRVRPGSHDADERLGGAPDVAVAEVDAGVAAEVGREVGQRLGNLGASGARRGEGEDAVDGVAAVEEAAGVGVDVVVAA
ncbi:MAG TPA: hypothetical protein VLQ78_12950, partial [Ornithinibacter sp.]|nr:hypothetical protein [Ornithinibacter sp.]